MRAGSVQQNLQDAVARLEGAGIPEARLKAEWVMASVLGCPRLELPLRREDALPSPARFDGSIAALAGGQPLQYVLGETQFMGLSLACDARALIPRPETEELVQAMLDHPRLWRRSRPAILDVGTGTGCIILALAHARPHADYEAVDSSAAALELAEENARRLHRAARIRFRPGDLLKGVLPRSLDAVVSNPPYIATEEWSRLPRWIRDAEPREALEGGPDGLAVIRALIPQAFTALRPGGILFMEMGSGQSARVERLVVNAGFSSVLIRRDLAGHERIAMAEKA